MDLKSRYENHPAQQTYGALLGKLVNIGFLMLVATFGVYVFGLLDPLVPKAELAQVWELPLHEFLAQTGAPTGWGWVRLMSSGDYLSISAIAFLASVSVVCYLTLIPAAWAGRNKVMGFMIAVELGLILLAASDLLDQFSH